ncbi:hypothetical protein PSBY109024_20295 [Pseudoalteromonas byunsanensis]
MGNKLEVTQGTGNNALTTQYEYDALGRLAKTSQGAQVTTYQYDGNNNLIKKTENFGRKLVDKNSPYNALSPYDDQRISYFVYNEANQMVAEFTSKSLSYFSPSSVITGPIDDIGPVDPPVEVMSSTQSISGQTWTAETSKPTSTTTTISGNMSLHGTIRYFEYDNNGRQIASHRLLEEVTVAAQFIMKADDVDMNAGEFSYEKVSGKIKGALGKEKVSEYTSFDENGRKSLHINGDGGVTQWHYDSQGRVYELTRWGQRAKLSDTAKANLVKGTLEPSELTKFGDITSDSRVRTLYNDKGQARFTITLVEGSQASVKESRYDAAGQLTSTIAYADLVAFGASINIETLSKHITNSSANRDTQLFYDAAGRLRFSIDALGNVTEQRYNEVSDVINTIVYSESVNDNAGLSAKFGAGTLSYADLQGYFSASLLIDARVSSSEYNTRGQLTWQRHADGTTERYSYYDNGLKASYTNQKGATWTYKYNNAGQLEFERGPKQTTYDWSGNQLNTVTDVQKTKYFSYDGLGNVTSITEGGQRNQQWVVGLQKATTYFDYDNAGRQTAVRQNATTNAPATITTTVYDALGRAISSTQGAVKQSKVYDNTGNVRFEMNGEGDVTEYRYNALGQQVTIIKYADQTTSALSSLATLSKMVDEQGNLRSDNPAKLSVSQDDRRIDMRYDKAGRKVQVDIGIEFDYQGKVKLGQFAPQSTRFSYNAFGQEVKKEQLYEGAFSVAGYKALTTYSYYNELGRKVASVDPANYLTTMSYNEFGEVASQTEYALALSGDVTEHAIPQGSQGNSVYGENRTTAYYYDEMGRVTHTVRMNVDVNSVKDNMSLDAKHHVVSKQDYDELGNVISTQTIATNSADISLLRAPLNGAVQSKYDETGRLIYSASAMAARTNVIDAGAVTQSDLTEYTARQVTSYGYDILGNLVKLKQHANRVEINSLADDQLILRDSPNDKLTRHEYNTRGQLIREFDALGNITVHKYNELGLLSESRKEFEVESQQAHYSFKTVVTQIDGDFNNVFNINGLPPGFVFNSQTGKITNNASFGFSDRTTYSVTLTASAEYIPNVSHRTQTYTLSAATTSLQVNGWQPASDTGGDKEHLTTYKYDKNGQLIAKFADVVAKGAAKPASSHTNWTTRYNAFGEVKKDDQGVYVYNKFGQLRQTTKGDGVLTTNYYDLAGRLTKSIHAMNGTTEYERNALGQATTIKQPKFNNGKRQPIITQKFDRWGNIIEIKDAVGAVTKAQYNGQNKVIKETLPTVAVASETGRLSYMAPVNLYYYDMQGNLVRKVDANGNQQTFKFNVDGKQTVHEDALGNKTYTSYDIFNRKSVVKDAQNRITTTGYDRLDQVVETGQFGVKNGISDEYRMVNSYGYDALGNRNSEIDAMGGEVNYRHDALGHVIFSRDEMDREKEYRYDKNGKQTFERYSSVYRTANIDENTRVFDDFGRLKSGNDLSGKKFTYTYGRDKGLSTGIQSLTDAGEFTAKSNIGRLIHKWNEYGQDIHYSYYENGWLKSIEDDATGSFTRYEYDDAGRVTAEVKQSWDDLQRVIYQRTVNEYDSHGRIKFTETTAYNNTAALGDTPKWVPGDIISRVTYQYDAVGNRRSMKVQNGLTGEIKPRENKLKIEKEISFMRGSKMAGMGYMVVSNDFGVNKDSLKITYRQSGQVRSKPEWLEVDIVTLDGNSVQLEFSQIGEIGINHGDFIVEVSAQDDDGVVKQTSALFNLEAYKDHIAEVQKAEIDFTRGADHGGYGLIDIYDRNGISLENAQIEVVRIQMGQRLAVPAWLSISQEQVNPRLVQLELAQIDNHIIGQNHGNFYLEFKITDGDGKSTVLTQLINLKDFKQSQASLAKQDLNFTRGTSSGGTGYLEIEDLNGLNKESVQLAFRQMGKAVNKPAWLDYKLEQLSATRVGVRFTQLGLIGPSHGDFFVDFSVKDKLGTEHTIEKLFKLNAFVEHDISVTRESFYFAQNTQSGGHGAYVIKDGNGLASEQSVDLKFFQMGNERSQPSWLEYTKVQQHDGSVRVEFNQVGMIGKKHGNIIVRFSAKDSFGRITEYDAPFNLTQYVDKVTTVTQKDINFAQHASEGGHGVIVLRDENGIKADPTKIVLTRTQMGQTQGIPGWLKYELIQNGDNEVKIVFSQSGYIGKQHGDFVLNVEVTDNEQNTKTLAELFQLERYVDAQVSLSGTVNFTRGTVNGGSGYYILEDLNGLRASDVSLSFEQMGEARDKPQWLNYTVKQVVNDANKVRIDFTQAGLIGQQHGDFYIDVATKDGDNNIVTKRALFALKSYADTAATSSGQFSWRRGETAQGGGRIVLTDPNGISKDKLNFTFVQEGKTRTQPSWLEIKPLQQVDANTIHIDMVSTGYIGKHHGSFFIDIASVDNKGYPATTRQLVTINEYIDKLPSIKSSQMQFAQHSSSGGSGYIELHDPNGLLATSENVSLSFRQMGQTTSKPSFLNYTLERVNDTTVGVRFSQAGYVGKHHGDFFIDFTLTDQEDNVRTLEYLVNLQQYVDSKARISQSNFDFTRGTVRGGSGYIVIEDANGINAGNVGLSFEQMGQSRSKPGWLGYTVTQQGSNAVRINFSQTGTIGTNHGDLNIKVNTLDGDQNTVVLTQGLNLKAYADSALSTSGSFDFRQGDSNKGSGYITLTDANGISANSLSVTRIQGGTTMALPSWLNLQFQQVNSTTVRVNLSSNGYIGQNHGDFYLNFKTIDADGYEQSASQLLSLKQYIPPTNYSTSVSSSFDFRRGESNSGSGYINISDSNGLSTGNVSLSFEQSGSTRSKPSFLNYSISQNGSNGIRINFSSVGYIGSNHGNFYVVVRTTDDDGYTNTSKQLVSLKAYIPPAPPTDYATSISGSFNFTRGTSRGGSGSVTITDRNGISTSSVSLSRVQAGKSLSIPSWLSYSVQRISSTQIRVNLSQSGYIGSSHGDFFLKVSTRDNINSSSSSNLYFGLRAPSTSTIRSFSPTSFSLRSAAVMAEPVETKRLSTTRTMSSPMLMSAPTTSLSSMSSTSSTTTSSTTSTRPAAKLEEYWFTYDGNNRVVIDGGNLIDGQVKIDKQGQYIAYNEVGQQKLVISSKGKRANQYIYNSWGQLAQVDGYQNMSEVDLFGARVTLAKTPNHANWRKESQFEYDALGRVTQKYDYFHANANEYLYTPGGETPKDLETQFADDPIYKVFAYYGGAIKHKTSTRYNAAGEVIRITEKELNVNIDRALKGKISPNQYNTGESVYVANPWTESSLRNQSISQGYSYSVAGRLGGYEYHQLSGVPDGVKDKKLVHVFYKRYEGRDTYLEKSTTGKGSTEYKDSQHLRDATTVSSYDANGNRTRIEEHITDSRNKDDAKKVHARYMRYDNEGKLLSKVTGQQTALFDPSKHVLTTGQYPVWDRSGPTRYGEPEMVDYVSTAASKVGFVEDKIDGKAAGSYYLYSGRNYLGEINKSGLNTIKGQHFSAPKASTASTMARHQVQEGDSLKSIAKLYYGSEDLWYMIADANGLGAGSELQQGTMLDIPARANHFNSHDNFKPMNLGEVIGDTTPSMPYVPPPPEAGCNAVASIVMIAVAVVATIYTAGAASSLFSATAISGSAAGTVASAGIAAMGGTVAGLSGAAAVGAAAASAAIGGFVGSVASQVVGKAMGAVDSFSLKGALASGLTAGATAGMGSYLQGFKGLAAVDEAGNAIKIADNAYKIGSAGRAIMGASSAVSSVVANKLVGNSASFRWGNVAASALTSYAGAGLGIGNSDTPLGFVTSGNFDTFGGIANSALRYGSDKLFGNQASWNFGNVAVDAFGNALGNSIVSKMQEQPKPQNSGNSSQGQNSQNPQVAGQNGATDLNKRYKEGDFIGYHEDGRKMYAGSVDENGQVISQVIPLEREAPIIETSTSSNDWLAGSNLWNNSFIDWGGLNNLQYKKSFNFSSYQEAQFNNPVRERGFFGRKLDSFNQWKTDVFNSYEDLAITSGGGFGTAAVAFLETPSRLGLGVLEGGLTLGGLVFDSSVRQDAWDGLNYLYDNYDTVIPGAVNSWMDQSWNEQLADVFVFGGEGLLGGTAGKLSYSGVKYSAQWSKMKFNYDYRHYLTGTQVLDSDQVFYSFKNSNYFDPNSSFKPMELWMTPELMTPEVAIPKLALPFDSGYDTIMKVTLPQGTKIMNPRPVWSLFGKPGGGIETRSYNAITSDMYQTYSVDEFFRGGN